MNANSLMKNGLPGAGRPPRGTVPVIAVLGVIALMYAIDMAVLRFVPVFAAVYSANFAVPFDLMVCVPLVFYLLFVRKRGITPIAAIRKEAGVTQEEMTRPVVRRRSSSCR